jgi:hypothetical protein
MVTGEPQGQERRWSVAEAAWKDLLPDLPDEVVALLATPVVASVDGPPEPDAEPEPERYPAPGEPCAALPDAALPGPPDGDTALPDAALPGPADGDTALPDAALLDAAGGAAAGGDAEPAPPVEPRDRYGDRVARFLAPGERPPARV